MEYGKLIDGVLNKAPNGIELEDGSWIIGMGEALEKELLARDYKPLEYTDPPEPKENYILNYTWKEENDKLRQVWSEEYVEPEYTDEERIAVLEALVAELMGGGE